MSNYFNNIELENVGEDNPIKRDGVFNSLIVGSGNNAYRVDRQGLWLGSNSFSSAKFSVDMHGNLTANNVSLSGAIKTGAGSQINGTYIDSLTANKITAGTIDANIVTINNLTVGTNVNIGTAQDSAGVTTIIGNTVTTGYVNALAVVAGSVAAENITGTYITGKTVQTSVTGDRVLLNGVNGNLEFKNGNTLYADIATYKIGDMIGFNMSTYDNNSIISMNEYAGVGDIKIDADYVYLFGAISLVGSTATAAMFPLVDSTYNIGSSSYAYKSLFTDYISNGSTTMMDFSSTYITFNKSVSLNGNSLYLIDNLDVNGNCDIEGYVDINNYLTVHGVFTAKGKMYSEGGLYMNNLKIEGVADPTSAQDAATKAWVEANFQAKS